MFPIQVPVKDTAYTCNFPVNSMPLASMMMQWSINAFMSYAYYLPIVWGPCKPLC